MGYSVSGGTLIVTIGLFLALSTFAPAVTGGISQLTEAQHTQRSDLLSQQNSGVEITNATYNESSNVLTVDVKNTGTETFSVSNTDLLVDGAYQTNMTTTVDGNGARTIWTPSEQLRMETTHTSAPSRVQVTTTYGVSRASETQVSDTADVQIGGTLDFQVITDGE